MRTPGILLVLALASAAVLAATASREPFAARLVRLEAEAAVPEMKEHLASESLAVNAAMLALAGTPELRLNAELALRRYPTLSPAVIALYAGEREFQDVLTRYGPSVVPPISYFLDHEVRSLEVLRAAGDAVEGARRMASRIMGNAPEVERDSRQAATATTAGAQPLTPEERGWYAIAFIREEGHDFLGQFLVNPGGRVEWVQTERVTEAAAEFFTSGIRSLETRFRQEEVPDLADYLWAGVDLSLAAGAVKVLRLGRAVGSGARGSLAARTVVRGGRTALRVGRYGIPVAVAYAVVRHPSLISGLAAQVATVMGWPVMAVQGAVWFAVLLPVFFVVHLVLRLMIRPTLALLGAVTRGLLWLKRHDQTPVHVRPGAVQERIVPRLGDLPSPADRHDDNP